MTFGHVCVRTENLHENIGELIMKGHGTLMEYSVTWLTVESVDDWCVAGLDIPPPILDKDIFTE